jgi:hypothetical protein
MPLSDSAFALFAPVASLRMKRTRTPRVTARCSAPQIGFDGPDDTLYIAMSSVDVVASISAAVASAPPPFGEK